LSKAADTRRLLNDRDQKLVLQAEKAETVSEGASDFRDLNKQLLAKQQQKLENNPLYKTSNWIKNFLKK
jgi:inorganic pyrophosphatase